MTRKRKPWLAALLSAIAPGLGQVYCGHIKRAIWLFACYWLCITIVIAIFVYGRFGVFDLILALVIGIGYWLFIIIDAAKLARRSDADFCLHPYNRWYIYAAVSVLIVFMPDVHRVLIQSMHLYMIPGLGVYKAYKMPAAGMENTLMAGDYLMADLTAYRVKNPKRGDVIIFLSPVDKDIQYIKRCVAVPGDTIEIRDNRALINQNEERAVETIKFVASKSAPKEISPRDNFGPFEVPANSYFVLGDNRDNSFDSRYWGPIPAENIVGEAKRIYWSSDFSRIGKHIE